MKIKYFQDTDSLHIELCPAEGGEARDLDDNTLLGLDGSGRLCSITIEHASDRIDIHSLKSVSASGKGMLNLTAEEQGWLNEYRRQLQERFPDLVEDIFIYGPYARGVSDPDVDMNTLVLIREGDREKKEEIGYLGYTIDLSDYFVTPLIGVFTKEEWAEQKRKGDPFYQMVADDGISVA